MALAAVRKGKSVAVVERNAKAVGASIPFGFISVSGRKAGDHWGRARRSRNVWAKVSRLPSKARCEKRASI